MKGKLIFQETQSFVGTITWYLTLVFTVPLIGLFLWGLYQQLVLGEPWGDKPADNMTLVFTSLFTIAIVGGVLGFISINELAMKIDKAAIYVKFYPYVRSFKEYKKEDIKEAYVRKYKPILEYGGWGFRTRFGNGKAYNVTGNQGLQLVFQNGKKLLIGTRKPEELKRAIDKFNANG